MGRQGDLSAVAGSLRQFASGLVLLTLLPACAGVPEPHAIRECVAAPDQKVSGRVRAIYEAKYLDSTIFVDKSGAVVRPPRLMADADYRLAEQLLERGTPEQAKRRPAKDRPGDYCPLEKGNTYGECQIKRVVAALQEHVKDSLRQTGGIRPVRVVIFIHGGLNGHAEAAWRSLNQRPEILRDGAYPIFINWDTGPFRTYGDQILNVREGRRTDTRASENVRLFNELSTPAFALGDVLQGIARAPGSWVNQGTVVLRREFETRTLTDDPVIAAHDNVLYEADPESKLVTVRDRAYFAVTSPAKAATVPFVDAFGNTAWENMRRRARSLVWRQDEFEDPPKSAFDFSAIDELSEPRKSRTGAAAVLIRKLQSLLAKPLEDDILQAGRNRGTITYRDVVQIDLIAHSMGAIVANSIIRNFDLHFENVVYLAAAATIKEFMDEALPRLRLAQTPTDHGTAYHLEGRAPFEEYGRVLSSIGLQTRVEDGDGVRHLRLAIGDSQGMTAIQQLAVRPNLGNALLGSRRVTTPIGKIELSGAPGTLAAWASIKILNPVTEVKREKDQTVETRSLPVKHDSLVTRIANQTSLFHTIRGDGQTCFFNISLHPDRDSRELTAFGLAPGGSLLGWIDNFYLRSPSDLDRTLGRWDNVRRLMHQFTDNSGELYGLDRQMTFTVLGKGDDKPFGHGDFTDVFGPNGKIRPRVCTGYGDLSNATFKYWRPRDWLGQHTGKTSEAVGRKIKADGYPLGSCIARAWHSSYNEPPPAALR